MQKMLTTFHRTLPFVAEKWEENRFTNIAVEEDLENLFVDCHMLMPNALM